MVEDEQTSLVEHEDLSMVLKLGELLARIVILLVYRFLALEGRQG